MCLQRGWRDLLILSLSKDAGVSPICNQPNRPSFDKLRMSG